MVIELQVPDTLIKVVPSQDLKAFARYLQDLVDHRLIGALRYEKTRGPDRRKKYLTRLNKELDTYGREGDYAQLLNIGVYCYLESQAPEHPEFHYNPRRESVTRTPALRYSKIEEWKRNQI